MRFAVVIFKQPATGAYVVTAPNVPGAQAIAWTAEDACADIVRQIRVRHTILMLDRAPLPKSPLGPEEAFVEMPGPISAKYRLYAEILKSGLSREDVAALSGRPRSHVDRLLDLRIESKVDDIAVALGAVLSAPYCAAGAVEQAA